MHNLLLQQFSPNKCRALFPKTLSKEVIKEINDIKNEVASVEQLTPGSERMDIRLDITNICKMMHKHHKTKSLRIDLKIIDLYINEMKWIDATCIHPTCKYHIKNEINDLSEGLISALEARTNNQKNQMEGRKGYAILKQTQTKHNRYAPLIAVAEKQFQTRRRMQKLIFWVGVASTYRKLDLETIKLQEWLTSIYK